jgi:hypothetical protein
VNKKLCVVFAALMAVPGALLGQEKPPAQAAPPANPITASERLLLICEQRRRRCGAENA